MGSVTIGVDVGQRVDPTAIAVCEREEDRYVVRYLERLPLGTSYPAVAEHVGRVYRGAVAKLGQDRARDGGVRTFMLPRYTHEPWPVRQVFVIVDATGVGTPCIDLIRERAAVAEGHLTGVFFTSGDRCTVKLGAPEGSLGKAYLVSRLQALIQAKRIALPETSEARALADELLNYELRVTDDASVTAGAFKTGTHDDLATALGLAVLVEPADSRVGITPY